MEDNEHLNQVNAHVVHATPMLERQLRHPGLAPWGPPWAREARR